jgi:hypothetical protein
MGWLPERGVHHGDTEKSEINIFNAKDAKD